MNVLMVNLLWNLLCTIPDLTWDKRDPRLKLTMRNTTEVVRNSPSWIDYTGYQMRKYVDFTHVPWSTEGQTLIRIWYDTLCRCVLMYAEAKMKQAVRTQIYIMHLIR